MKISTKYKELADVLFMALDQAQNGKGKERHSDGEAFSDQIICRLTRSEGSGYPRGQAIKKIDEAKRLPKDRAIDELLGAINYLAADIIVMMEGK